MGDDDAMRGGDPAGDGMTAGAGQGSIDAEVASQPACWLRAAGLVPAVTGLLPAPGERVAVTGCGTSWFIAQSYAALREESGHGETDAFAASEMPVRRRYDRVVVLSRSGTTTEILQLLGKLAGVPTVVITADARAPVAEAADAVSGLAWESSRDPMAELVLVQRLAAAVARARGLDPDRPRNLNRSVILAPR